MLRVRFAPSPTGLLHIGLEALGRETCLRRIEQAIGKLKTS
jgi:glutamyl/glutaminyl-tRNA synthetase